MKCKKKVGLLDKEETQTLNWILSRLLLNHKIAKTALPNKDANTAVVNAAKKHTLAKLSIYKTPTILSLKHLNLLYLRQSLPLK
jgi:hypothetical protein